VERPSSCKVSVHVHGKNERVNFTNKQCFTKRTNYHNPMEKIKLNSLPSAMDLSLGFQKKIVQAWSLQCHTTCNALQLMKYLDCKQAIELFLQQEKSTRLGLKLQSQAYINDRCPVKAKMTDLFRIKIGRQGFPNRLRSMREINFDWVTGISDNLLNIRLKKTFFKL